MPRAACSGRMSRDFPNFPKLPETVSDAYVVISLL